MRQIALICILALLALALGKINDGHRGGVEEARFALSERPHLTDIIEAAAGTYNLPASLIAAIIKVESGFDPKAVSNKGAVGLMQLSLSTRRAMRVTNPFDPVQNILAGAKYLRSLLDRFNGDLTMAIAAYNAGPGAVERHGGIPPYRQTQAFVPKVLTYYNQFESGTAVD